MAGPMKWRNRQVTREVDHYRARIEAERKSQEADTDTDADAIRLGAPEIVPVKVHDPGASRRDGGQAYHGAAAGGDAREASDMATQAEAEAGFGRPGAN